MKNQNHHQMRVFISRYLDSEQSPFLKLLNQNGLIVTGQSMIEFSAVPFNAIPHSDWIFFYSKTAIAYFFEQKPSQFVTKDVKWATIGEASANYLKKYNIEPDFVGTGEPVSTAKAFLDIAEGQEVLFPRAFHSKKSIQELLNGDIKVVDFVVYTNSQRQNIQRRNEDVLVFTSPMNAHIYLNKFQLLPHQKIVAIGNTTAKTLRKLGVSNFKIADKPSEYELAASVLKLNKQQQRASR